MIELDKKLKFKFTWRSYQEQFLSRFESHIQDDHLHIVAPPGSGKTILGLEMLLRVAKPSLVLSPTLTIRNQWKSRLESFFLTDSDWEEYTLDLKNPSFLTFSTYQSLHALDKSMTENQESLLKYIEKHGIRTLVLDEAHHLKNTWWTSLFKLKQLEHLTVISLTATPPYDSTAQELNKYFELCGPLDDEIAVPDLIANGDLCPHQDFVYFSQPDEAQIKYIVSYREQIIAFTNALVANERFKSMLLEHPIYARSEENLELLYEHPEFFSSVLIFLKASGHVVDRRKLKFLGFEGGKIEFPNLSYEWMEILLQQLLVDQREALMEHEELLFDIERQLARIGVFSKKRVNFIGDEQLYRTLANSPSKLKSISEILKHEKDCLEEKLKAVILTDFIRKEYLDFKGTDTAELKRLGVASIFQYLRIKGHSKKDIAVLTGSLVILHRSALNDFELQTNSSNFNAVPLPSDEEFVLINSFGNVKNSIVDSITRLFQKGIIKVLIGTKALLGEGWDAPAINTLVLASYVGSFVSSNQMRGRAIRIDGEAPDKTGNIWHLACLDPTAADGGKDWEKLNRRFEAFSGVSLSGTPYIENGLERLQIPTHFDADVSLDGLNAQMVHVAKQREALKTRWFDAISKGSVLVREVKIPYLDKVPFKEAKRLRWGSASKYLLVEVVVGAGLFFPEFLAKHIGTLVTKGVLQFAYLFLAGIFIALAPKTYKAIKLYFLFGNTYGKTKKIGAALLEILYRTKRLHTPFDAVSVETEQQLNGTFVCYLKGATNAESSMFVHLLAEILAPVENPRYLLVYTHWIKRHWGLRNYYVVPEQFGKRKKDAQLFHHCWKNHVDSSRLLYTRSLKGRRALLKARLSHIVYQFKEVSKKAITWK
ncbi:DEAD/DEAH box helicase [Aggregatimonas sangjinii]|uniref:DEAD/DEAH box helicase n=1 Tax=Aggregatimonas sangjinii TaxID=2583587 RepID=A0A5B7SSH2_9FLAO|nr:DEAD/DEAH box helicase family protein [Aggregatimonas sangjinii]QCX01735.1 DEAD/DEAH box helicase [Aggregatimonas sangjinii]